MGCIITADSIDPQWSLRDQIDKSSELNVVSALFLSPNPHDYEPMRKL